MKRMIWIPVLLAGMAACQDATAPTAAPDAPSAVRGNVDPELVTLLSGADPADRLVVIVNYDPARTSRPALSAAARGLGAGVIEFEHLSMIAALATPQQILALSALNGVEGVYDNGMDQVLLRESVQSIRAPQAWAAGYTGKGVGVAIIDSGINGLNPDVAYPGKTVANLKFTARLTDFTEDDGTPRVGGQLYVDKLPNTDLTSGHGTHVAGTVAGTGASTGLAYRGVAPGAHLVGLSVGEGISIVNLSVIQAVDWLIENAARYNIQVVNCSWGSSGEFDPLDPTNEAMTALHDAGITVVFAAGNEGPDQNTMNRRSVNPAVISVAAGCKINVLDPTNSASQCDDGRQAMLANFSSRGIPGDAMWRPDITAPGVFIVSTRSYTGTLMNALDLPDDAQTCNIGLQNLQNYTCASGTSMASPHVAGVVALMEEASGGRLKPDQALAILRVTAQQMPGYTAWEVGSGYADAHAAAAYAATLAQ